MSNNAPASRRMRAFLYFVKGGKEEQSASGTQEGNPWAITEPHFQDGELLRDY